MVFVRAGYRIVKIPRGRPVTDDCATPYSVCFCSTDFSRSVTRLTLLFLPGIERRGEGEEKKKEKKKEKKISPSKRVHN